MGDDVEPLWIRSFALSPRRLSDGRWAWLRHYEWRWAAPDNRVPHAVQRPLLETRGIGKQPALVVAQAVR